MSEEEQALAAAMMDIYAHGSVTLAEVAEKLTERGVIAPGSGKTDWDAASLEAELKAANASLDAAYQSNGFGA